MATGNFANLCSIAVRERPQTSLNQLYSTYAFPQDVLDEPHPVFGNLTTFCPIATQELPQTTLAQRTVRFISEPTPDMFSATSFLLCVGAMTILHRRHKEVTLKDMYSLSQRAQWIGSSLISTVLTGSPLGIWFGPLPDMHACHFAYSKDLGDISAHRDA